MCILQLCMSLIMQFINNMPCRLVLVHSTLRIPSRTSLCLELQLEVWTKCMCNAAVLHQ